METFETRKARHSARSKDSHAFHPLKNIIYQNPADISFTSVAHPLFGRKIEKYAGFHDSKQMN